MVDQLDLRFNKVICIFVVTILNSLSVFITVKDRWGDFLSYITNPIVYFLDINLLSFRPVVIFCELVEPYSLVILIVGHVIALSLSKNAMLEDIKSFLSSDFVTSKIKAPLSRGISLLLPAQTLRKLTTLYTSYSDFSTRFRK